MTARTFVASTNRRHRHWSRGVAALLATLLALQAPAVAAQPRGSSPSGPGASLVRLDDHVRARLAGADDELERVIITLRPGARQGVLRKLEAHGARLTASLDIIEAVAADLPVGLLKSLAKDRDVLGISADAEMRATGVTSAGVSGTAVDSAYTLRRTLGLDSSIDVGASSSATGLKVSSVSWSHTVAAGTGRVLVVDVTSYSKESFAATAVTYGGVALTRLGTPATQNGVVADLWSMTAPAVGTATVVVTVNGPASIAAAATTYYGVHPTAPFGVLQRATGGGASKALPLSSAPGEVAIAVAGSRAVSSFTNGAAQMPRWTNKTGTAGGDIWGAGAHQPGAASVSMAWTTSGSGAGDWAAAGVSLKPASSGGTSFTGAGITVAVLDSGLFQDGGATTRIKTTRDFTSGSATPSAATPVDGFGHGTHIAGLIAGDKSEALGMAPGASYVSLRVLNGFGVGLTSHVINAVQWAVANRAAYGIDVINLSLGHPVYEPAASDPLVQAVEAAVRAGIVVVVSAGNIGVNPATGQVGYAGITSPGNAPSAITVGAVRTMDTTRRTDDLVSDYSSRGPSWFDGFAKPDLVAPGHRLMAAATTSQYLYTTYPAFRATAGGRAYMRLSGTSMAAGVVTGTVALMLEASKTAFGVKPTPNAVKAMLQYSAFDMSDAAGVPYDRLTQGAGALNAAGALQLSAMLNPTAPTNAWWVTSAVTESTSVDGQNIVWGENVVWGENIVWGESIYANQPAWANNIVWGANVVWGNNIVWGENIVWGANVVWGNNIVWGANIVWGENIVWGATNVSGDLFLCTTICG